MKLFNFFISRPVTGSTKTSSFFISPSIFLTVFMTMPAMCFHRINLTSRRLSSVWVSSDRRFSDIFSNANSAFFVAFFIQFKTSFFIKMAVKTLGFVFGDQYFFIHLKDKFSRILFSPESAAKKVFFSRNSFKMIRIYTTSISTNMINIVSFWNQAFCHFIRNSMNQCLNPFVFFFKTYFTVSCCSICPIPKPAKFSFSNTVPESDFNRDFIASIIFHGWRLS